MIGILISGGWMMIPLILCSLVAVTVILERTWFFFKIPTVIPANRMISLVALGNMADALSIKERNPHPILRILATGIMARTSSPEKAMEAASILEIGIMKRGLAALDTIITLAPLLGLLGTIIGMIDSFGIMADQGIGQPHAVTGGVAEALICTATGIFVAVISLIPYNYFLARVDLFIELIEHYATRMAFTLTKSSNS